MGRQFLTFGGRNQLYLPAVILCLLSWLLCLIYLLVHLQICEQQAHWQDIYLDLECLAEQEEEEALQHGGTKNHIQVQESA